MIRLAAKRTLILRQKNMERCIFFIVTYQIEQNFGSMEEIALHWIIQSIETIFLVGQGTDSFIFRKEFEILDVGLSIINISHYRERTF